MIEIEPGTDWRDLQDRVATILAESGLVTAVGRSLMTARGTVEIDVYGTDPLATPPAVYLCECKRWRSAVPQGEVMTFRTVVGDAGAHFGLFISAAGFQAGAFEVVQHTNIHLLDWPGFQDSFLERWCRSYWISTFRQRADRLAGSVEPLVSDAGVREARGEALLPEEAVGLFAHDMWGHPFNDMLDRMAGQGSPSVSAAIWGLQRRYRRFLPRRAAEAVSLRDLLDAMIEFSEKWLTSRA